MKIHYWRITVVWPLCLKIKYKRPSITPKLRRDTVAGQEVLDHLVASGRIEVEVQAVTCCRLDVCLEGLRVRECLRRSSRDAGSIRARELAVAVSSAEGNVVLTSDDENWTGKRTGAGRAADGEEFTDRHGLLGLLAYNGEADIVHAGVEEGPLQRGEIRVGQVARGVVVFGDGVVVAVDEVVDFRRGDDVPGVLRAQGGDAKRAQNAAQRRDDVATNTIDLDPGADTGIGGVAEPEGLIQARTMKIPSCDNVGQEHRRSREASENNAVGVVGVLG
jgi:hypothetical protein